MIAAILGVQPHDRPRVEAWAPPWPGLNLSEVDDRATMTNPRAVAELGQGKRWPQVAQASVPGAAARPQLLQ